MNISDTSTSRSLPRFCAGNIVQLISRDGQQTCMAPLVEVDGEALILGRPYAEPDAEEISGWTSDFFEFHRWLLIRTVDRGVVYVCEARVLASNTHRACLSLLGSAREVRRRYQRESGRFSCSLCAHLHGHSQRADGCIKNISENGCQLTISDQETLQEVRQLQASKQQLCFEVLFPHADTYRTLQGRVVTVIEDDDHGCHHIGVQFRSEIGAVAEYINLLRLD